MPRGYKLSDKPSRYQPLIDLLATSDGNEVVLTFKEIAAIIGGPLPESAIFYPAWWTYGRYAHVQLWRAVGWHAHADRHNLRVVFARDEVGDG